LFAESELELACNNFGAEVQDYAVNEVPIEITETIQESPTAATSIGENIELYGKSGTPYRGTIYHKEAHLATLPAEAIICLSNSALQNGTWHHTVNAIYKTGDVQQEMDNFKQRGDISHMMVLPIQAPEQNKADQVDDLIRSYLHQ
jgi:hypothetical protein